MNPPPLLVSFSTIEDFFEALQPSLAQIYGSSFKELFSKGMPPLVSVRCLSLLFGFSAKFVGSLVYRSSRYYRLFTIPKGRNIRKIQAPKVALKIIQKWFGHHLGLALPHEPYVFGFIKGKSAIDAALCHIGAKWVYSLDIEDFFPSISQKRIEQALIGLGYDFHGAEIAAYLCCYKGFLAQGSPASPVISNLVFNSTDKELAVLADALKIRYTRYADDMVFSGDQPCPSCLPEAVKKIIREMGWKIAAKKELLFKEPNRLKVHGLLVDGNTVRLTKGYRNKIRAFSHLLSSGMVSEEDKPRLAGHVSYGLFVQKRSQETTSD